MGVVSDAFFEALDEDGEEEQMGVVSNAFFEVADDEEEQMIVTVFEEEATVLVMVGSQTL